MSKYYINKIEIKGCKNITKKIEMYFTNQTLDEKIENQNLKIIYGENGAGKTAIITAINIYRRLFRINDYLMQTEAHDYLNNVINKTTGEFIFKIILTKKVGNESYTYSHEIHLKNTKSNISISYECISKLKGKRINGNYDVIFENNNGNIKYKECVENICQTYRTVYNMGSVNPFICFILKWMKLKNQVNQELSDSCIAINDVATMIYTSIDDYSRNHSLENFKKNIFNKSDLSVDRSNFHGEDVINIKEKDEYEKKISNLTSFIKIFKHDLVNIDTDYKEVNGYYIYSKIFNYGDYRIDYEYESSGIKRLCYIFDYIQKALDGNFVFIDELDANINGVYLAKLSAFIMNNCCGLLCYTTHNTEPMYEVDSKKDVIYFVTDTCKLVSFKPNGNLRCDKQYREGYIEDLPLNIFDFDFFSCFDVKENK